MTVAQYWKDIIKYHSYLLPTIRELLNALCPAESVRGPKYLVHKDRYGQFKEEEYRFFSDMSVLVLHYEWRTEWELLYPEVRVLKRGADGEWASIAYAHTQEGRPKVFPPR